MSDIEKAMKTIKEAMIADGPSELGSIAHSWHCNIAMACNDAITQAEGTKADTHTISNNAASRFMKLCFGVETTNTPTQPKRCE